MYPSAAWNVLVLRAYYIGPVFLVWSSVSWLSVWWWALFWRGTPPSSLFLFWRWRYYAAPKHLLLYTLSSRNRPLSPVGLWDVKDLTLSRQSAHSGKVVSSTHRPRSASQKHYYSVCGTNFCQRLGEPQGLVRSQVLGKLTTFFETIGSGTRNLQDCSIVP
jgi:hypothetical protein